MDLVAAPSYQTLHLLEWELVQLGQSAGNLNTRRDNGGGVGTPATDALFFGGVNPSVTNVIMKNWNGTSWTNQQLVWLKPE